jgi:ABC-type multidrug transport system fused ATPase/permease subunit
MRGMICGMAATLQETNTPSGAPRERGLFASGMRLVWSYIRLHPKPFLISLAGALVFAAASVLLTVALAHATNDVLYPAFDPNSTGPVPARDVWIAVFFLMLFGCLRALGIMVRRYYSGVAGERVMATLRRDVSDRYRDLALQYHRETPTGELLAHMEADVKAAVDVFWPVPFAAGVIALVFLAMIQMLRVDPWLALVGGLLLPALALMNRSFARRVEEPSRRAQEDIGVVSAIAHESIDGALVVKTLGREDAETGKIERAATTLRDHRITAGYVRATFEAGLDALPTLATVVLVAVGSWRIYEGAINVGDLIGVVALFGLLSWPMRFIGWILAELPRAVVGWDRLQTVFAEQVTVTPPADPVALPEGPLGISVRDVRLVYDGQAVLDGVSFDVGPGESVAIVGPTGVGKSTLSQLLVRLADPDEGTISVGGVDVRNADPVALRQAAAIVFQESFLFAASVRENLALDESVDDAGVVRSAMIASADRFIRELPHGYDTVVGERGHTLSGGQRQRVALGRALARAPRILILDDATSSVDPMIEANILHALRRELDTTLIVVAYRLSTIRLADRVIYLEDGRVAGTGSHEQLLATLPGYSAIIRAYERDGHTEPGGGVRTDER